MKKLLSLFVVVLSVSLMSCSQEQRPTNQESSTMSSSDPSTSYQNTMAEEAPTVDACSFVLGFDAWDPYQYVDIDDQVRGLDIEVVSAVAEQAGCSLEFVQGTWVSLLEGLREGEIDMLLGASKTQAREEFAYFSVPYRTEEFALYIRSDDAKHAGYADIEEFIANDSNIGVVGDYFYGADISNMLDDEKSAEQFNFAIMGELNIARLLDMDIDGFLEDSFVGASMIRRKALQDFVTPHGYTIQTGDIYVMFSRTSVEQEHVSKFNQAMADFKGSDEYKRIMNKYRGK
ncbi:transporter substrate-binding domain-containing protein [Glaciecola sp. XM2]|jgi:polar amino acid transport system substrate-binding protein|uniref:substrate-binding periplasmic protein n=1 Tax=Glaciecola sp. XM2 TaxID=1914931 RepID=UPI001BDE6D10|nr:transporter substrate-binding domain-containing protein [Glaciecola sp. XM2]MBT1450109.1 transporter substrate-binding domain-containing protein [Glaciecola sp. XM2]